MIKELEKEFRKYKPEKPDLEEFNFSLYNSSIILDSLSNDKLSDNELYKVVETNYGFILQTIFEDKDINYINLFANTRFLNIFNQVICKIPNGLTELQKMYCNSISYDYFSLPSHNDQYLTSLFLTLGRNVNKDLLSKLLILGIPEDTCIYLLIARNSSLDESLNVRRLNNIIIRSDSKIMTEQTVVKIYESLFNSMSILFQATMLDAYSQEALNSISQDAGIIYSTISLAVLDLLQIMPSSSIATVLRNYANLYNTVGGMVRFSIYSIAVSDYFRILQVADTLKAQELIIVP